MRLHLATQFLRIKEVSLLDRFLACTKPASKTLSPASAGVFLCKDLPIVHVQHFCSLARHDIYQYFTLYKPIHWPILLSVRQLQDCLVSLQNLLNYTNPISSATGDWPDRIGICLVSRAGAIRAPNRVRILPKSAAGGTSVSAFASISSPSIFLLRACGLELGPGTQRVGLLQAMGKNRKLEFA